MNAATVDWNKGPHVILRDCKRGQHVVDSRGDEYVVDRVERSVVYMARVRDNHPTFFAACAHVVPLFEVEPHKCGMYECPLGRAKALT